MSAASLSNPQTLNLYSYCGNDPINHVDPDGLFFGKLFGWIGKAFKWVFRVAAVVAVMAAAAVGQYWGSILITKGLVAAATAALRNPRKRQMPDRRRKGGRAARTAQTLASTIHHITTPHRSMHWTRHIIQVALLLKLVWVPETDAKLEPAAPVVPTFGVGQTQGSKHDRAYFTLVGFINPAVRSAAADRRKSRTWKDGIR